MRVDNNSPVTNKSQANKKKSGGSAARGFDRLLDTEEASSPSASAPIEEANPLQALLALQEVVADKEQASIDYSHSVLDLLKELQQSLLADTLSEHQLQQLQQGLKQTKTTISDPKLEGLIAEIELRAKVELAKHTVSV